MKIIEKKQSHDGSGAIKFLQQTEDNFIIETIFVSAHTHYICYSSQVGCPFECAFCLNGINTFYRNLTKDEIIRQCTNIVENLKIYNTEKSVLFACMGVGEPLLNYNNVVTSLKELNEKFPSMRSSLSTIGVIPRLIPQLAKDINSLNDFKLTISLNASNDETRKKLYPIHESMYTLKNVANKYREITRHEIDWSYVILDGVNNSEKNAKELYDFLEKGDRIKLTICNSVIDSPFTSSERNIFLFKQILEQKGIEVIILKSKGIDINAGLGQLDVSGYNKKNYYCRRSD